MIGIIPKLWLASLALHHPQAPVQTIVARAGMDPAHELALDEVCDDQACIRLLHLSSEVTGVPLQTLIDEFAAHFIADAAQRWPVWFEMSPTARDFLERQPRIHDSFRRGLDHRLSERDKVGSKFNITPFAHGLRVLYQSDNRLCALYMALARAVLAHYQDHQARVHETQCMLHGHPHCEFLIEWPDA